jgi:hypothetical protein
MKIMWFNMFNYFLNFKLLRVTEINERPAGYTDCCYVNILQMCLQRARTLTVNNKNYKYNFHAYSRQYTI